MRQLDLPFTQRGKRQQKRLHGPTKAFKCCHWAFPAKSKIIHATDSAMARKAFLKDGLPKNCEPLFVNIRAVRSYKHDSKPA